MILALALTVLAGAATAAGGLLAVGRWVRTDTGLAVALAFAGGAMVLVSVVEIVPTGAAGLAPSLGGRGGWTATLALVVLGAASAWLLGRVATRRAAVDVVADPAVAGSARMRRSGVVVAVAVAAHNLPEGLVTFVAALDDPAAGVTLAVAIALHNVPEGIAVAAPCMGAGGSRRRAVATAGLSGLAEPVGAVAGYLLLVAVLPPAAAGAAFGVVFGLVAGVMLLVGLVELVPGACRLLAVVPVLVSTLAGGAVMAASLALLGLA